MSFDTLLGNEKAKAYLKRLQDTGRVGGAMLFAGPEGVGKGLFASAFAKRMLQTHESQNSKKDHPDLHIYHPEGKMGMHSIESMRGFIHEVYLPPYESAKKVFILHSADRMLPDSANTLLKTLEEPSPDSVILLISAIPSRILPTILSRCQILPFYPLSDELIAQYLCDNFSKKSEEASELAHLARGSLGKAVRLVQGNSAAIRKAMIALLAPGRWTSYSQFFQALKRVEELLETDKKAGASLLQKEIEQSSKALRLSAIEQERLQKEADGVTALCSAQEVEEIFEFIAGWFRDLHLLKTNGDLRYLMNPDALKPMQQLVEVPLISLDLVLNKIKDARTAYERMIPFSNCLETLCIELGLL